MGSVTTALATLHDAAQAKQCIGYIGGETLTSAFSTYSHNMSRSANIQLANVIIAPDQLFLGQGIRKPGSGQLAPRTS